jgi:molecular chaperone DnaK (HSP70)
VQGVDCSKDKKAVQKLRKEAERAKRSLSTSHQETIEVDAFCGGSDLRETLSRAKFEELNADLFKKTLEPVQKVNLRLPHVMLKLRPFFWFWRARGLLLRCSHTQQDS